MDRLGLGYGELSADNPGLIYCSITGFGAGAGAELPGYDLLIQAVGGLMSITGDPDGEPQKVGIALVDVLSGLFSTVGILAALRHRERTGEGQLVEVDLLSALLASLVNQASGYTVAGAVPRRMGNALPSITPYEVYRTEEGELVLAVGNDRQFQSLCGHPRASGERAQTRALRPTPIASVHRTEMREVLESALAHRPANGVGERAGQRPACPLGSSTKSARRVRAGRQGLGARADRRGSA